MKVVAVIPFWSEYKFPEDSIPKRELIKLGDSTLINYAVQIANSVDIIDEVVIFSTNDEVHKFIDKKNKYKFIERDHDLDKIGVTIEDIIQSFLVVSDAEILVLIHPKCPFLKSDTISCCVEKVDSGEYDSALVVTNVRKLAWFNGAPLNYTLDMDTPSLSSIKPIVLESSSLYVFTRKIFENTRRRIGNNPFMKSVGHFEGFEVDKEEDYKMVELLINSGFATDES